jgi:hypothetical protein
MPDIATKLPSEAYGWTPKGAGRAYNPETLFGYIDGGAELYRAFNVREVLSRQYENPDGAEIIVDIFDMGSDSDAYGVYHHEMREGRNPGVARDSEYMEGALYFWKGRYFVSILALDETEESKRAVLQIGRSIAGAIAEDGMPSDLVSRLAQNERIAGQIRFFHLHSSLNAYYFVSDENLLNLHGGTDAVFARYKTENPTEGRDAFFAVMAVRYPNPEEAKAGHDRFLRGYLPDADREGVAKTEDGKWTAIRLKGKLIVAVFDAPSRDESLEALAVF